MLKLRRGVVVSADPLTVEVEGQTRPAWADEGLLGEMREGDEVIVNTAALDLGLGSGGFDVVHVNLSRGLAGGAEGSEHVMKLNYTSLQHPVEPVEPVDDAALRPLPVLVVPLHGHVAPAAWAVAQLDARLRVGYVQTEGGGLPGRLSRDVRLLRERGLLCSHTTAGHAYGGEEEAVTVVGAIDAAARRLDWDAAIVGPGPGILGSATQLGHGGLAALDSAHAALSLEMPTLLAPRLSGADPRERHRGLSHHTATVLRLLLAGVEVPLPEETGIRTKVELLVGGKHMVTAHPVDVEGYAASGLPRTTMGRDIAEDPLFFAAALAAGRALGMVARATGQ